MENGDTPQPPRYSAAELKEFEDIIKGKIEQAERTLEPDRAALMQFTGHGTDDTYKAPPDLEDGAFTLQREELVRRVDRQLTYIAQLKAALGRIHRGDYGVCRVTGKLIPKDRLRVVPHATLTVEAKALRREENRGRDTPAPREAPMD